MTVNEQVKLLQKQGACPECRGGLLVDRPFYKGEELIFALMFCPDCGHTQQVEQLVLID